MGTFGYLMPWCLAEDEETSLKLNWLPYHMQRGFNLNDSVLTAGSALNWGNNMSPATDDPQKIMELIAQDAVEKQQFAIGSGTPFVYRTILVTGNVARDLAKKYSSVKSLEKALINTARQNLDSRAYANYFANPGSAFNPQTYSLSRHTAKIRRTENAEVAATPPWLAWTGKKEMETVPVMAEGKTAILVTGDPNRNKTMCVPGGGFASVKIELPKNWDALTAAVGYQPLKSFYLQSNLAPAKELKQVQNYRRKNNSAQQDRQRRFRMRKR